MKHLSFTVALLLLSVSFVAAQQQSGIAGQFVDSEGAAIANARVLVHWDSAGSKVGLSDNVGIQNDIIMTTDAGGRYSAEVPTGFYDASIASCCRFAASQWANRSGLDGWRTTDSRQPPAT